jgi:predicted ATPase
LGWYETRAETQAVWPLLAYHYRYAEDAEKERRYVTLAGEAAEKVFANEAAISFYTRLLALLDAMMARDAAQPSPGALRIAGDKAEIHQAWAHRPLTPT